MAYETRPYINGEFVECKQSFRVLNPFNGEVVADVGLADEKHLQAALNAAKAVSPALRELPPYERAELLLRISGLIAGRKERFAQLITLEAGKPITLSRGEVDRAVGTFRIAAEEARRYAGELHLQEAYGHSGGKYAVIGRFPLSPVLAITPFNFPLNLVAHKVAPALAVGSAVIHKPARYTPLTALMLAQAYHDAGVPPGAYNVLPAAPATLNSLIASDCVQKISFTGSAEVGWALKAACGKKRITLELGGNAAAVVEDAGDLPKLAAHLARGAFAYAGQVCISVQRIFVRRELYADFTAALVEFTRNKIQSGDPFDEQVLNGPLISPEDVNRVAEWVAEAKEAGARILCGGTAEGNVFAPTVIENAPRLARVFAEEAFAPIVVVAPYNEFAEAVELVNDSRFGLQAGYFTRDLDKANYAFEHTECGAVLINESPIARLDHLPYGGVKDSGFGREGLRWAMDELTEPRLFVVRPAW